MPRFKLTLEYHGAPFVGWQRQDNGASVQGVLEAALARLEPDGPSVQGAGRTDAGVHATGQVAHADLSRDWDPFRLSEALNHHLKPHPVAVLAAPYLAYIALIDDQLGDVLDALEKSPYADNTVVVFTSDNGFHMGDKDSLFKDTLWEGGSRVPFIWAGPGIAQGETCEVPTSLLDIYPTLVDRISSPAASPLDGTSLLPLLENPDGSTWNGPAINVSGVRGLTGIHFAARSATHRYILCENGEEELYDHRADPLEHHNLADDPAQAKLKAELRSALERELARFDEKAASIEN